MRTDPDVEDERERKFLPVRLPDRFEIIDGEIVELRDPSIRSSVLATELTYEMNRIAFPNSLGMAYVGMLYRLPLVRERCRKPFVSFVSNERWPENRGYPSTLAWKVVPELAVEIISSNDFADEFMEKIKEYFDSGVTRVWVIYPRFEIAYIYESFSKVSILTRDQELTGEAFLPGFRLPLKELFPTEEEPPAQPA